ncbi:MAG: hypothetical protein M9887_02630 [Chitinophagales bacterium]|nr:hypothetical protein [Chitinophagales bacterium]
MKTKILLLIIICASVYNTSCKKKKYEEVIDPNKVYNGEVVRYYSECVSTGLNTPPYLMRVEDYTLDSFVTMSLPDQYRIEGMKLNFKITEDTINRANLICNTSIIPPDLKIIFEITE